MEHTNLMACSSSIAGVLLCVFLVCSGCAAGDDSATVALINQSVTKANIGIIKDENGHERIASLTLPNKASLQVLPHLGKLDRLEELKIGYPKLTDKDMETLPALPKLKIFSMRSEYVTDDALKCIEGMVELERLTILGCKQIDGSGFAYLTKLTNLNELSLDATSVNDDAVQHIVVFAKLKRIAFSKTKVTPEGLMRLTDLHWLEYIAPPNTIVDLTQDDVAQRIEWKAITLEFDKAHLASKRKARAAGVDVPPDSLPFSSPELADELERQAMQRRRAKAKAPK